MDANQLYAQGYHYYTSGKYADAEIFFRLLTHIKPKQGDFWLALGASLQMQKKYTQAIDCFGAAALLDCKEENPIPHMHAADCFWAIDKKEQAHQALNSALLMAKKDNKYCQLIEKLHFLHKRWTNE